MRRDKRLTGSKTDEAGHFVLWCHVQMELNWSAVVWQKRKVEFCRNFTVISRVGAAFYIIHHWRGGIEQVQRRAAVSGPKGGGMRFLFSRFKGHHCLSRTLNEHLRMDLFVLSYLHWKLLKGRLSALGDGERGRWGSKPPHHKGPNGTSD